MRLVKTIFLRFYTDTNHHEQFCGEIQVLPKKKTVPFKNSAELLNLLSRAVNKKAEYDEKSVDRLDVV